MFKMLADLWMSIRNLLSFGNELIEDVRITSRKGFSLVHRTQDLASTGLDGVERDMKRDQDTADTIAADAAKHQIAAAKKALSK